MEEGDIEFLITMPPLHRWILISIGVVLSINVTNGWGGYSVAWFLPIFLVEKFLYWFSYGLLDRIILE